MEHWKLKAGRNRSKIKVNTLTDVNGDKLMIRKVADSKKWYIYIHYTTDWKKPFYVGEGRSYRATASTGRNKFWHNIVKSNDFSFNVKIINFYDTQEEAFVAEKALIGFFGLRINNSGMLCNIVEGGFGCLGRKGERHPMYGKKHTEESIQKMSEALKGKMVGEKNPMYGKYGEQNPMWGRTHSEHTKNKQSIIKKGKYDGDKNPFASKRHSKETKQKLRDLNIGKKLSDSSKQKLSNSIKNIYLNAQNNGFAKSKIAMLVLDLNTGIFYYSITDAAMAYNLSKSRLSRNLKLNKAKGLILI